ncbi:MAG: hypothetical protein IPN53_22095 [Comamonadaceae bacterium]|nr:hypothetical protein [Comamonadaceae bacterium]
MSQSQVVSYDSATPATNRIQVQLHLLMLTLFQLFGLKALVNAQVWMIGLCLQRGSARAFAAGVWSSVGSLNAARTRHSATLLPNGKVLDAGGITGSDLASSDLV